MHTSKGSTSWTRQSDTTLNKPEHIPKKRDPETKRSNAGNTEKPRRRQASEQPTSRHHLSGRGQTLQQQTKRATHSQNKNPQNALKTETATYTPSQRDERGTDNRPPRETKTTANGTRHHDEQPDRDRKAAAKHTTQTSERAKRTKTKPENEATGPHKGDARTPGPRELIHESDTLHKHE
ncbi:hypothetical protein BV25DRAFT_1837414 [Artomyces pyxidatus]|uniref:Uncharacterized protein n=1 Tax=Artomyces pyxidatus TaxID=48021 RepID=A0ACB8T547_9AGAM|nr:hypothetical protein BV25DRAFT_1837414 [Artomyces pyxidatus]